MYLLQNKLAFFLLAIFILWGCTAKQVEIQATNKPENITNILEPASLDQGLNDLSNQISESLLSIKIDKIAVVPFSDLNGKINDFGIFLSDELIDHLFGTKKFEVIERLLVDRIIEENRLSLSGLFDPDSAKDVGMLLGADAIATGTYTILKDTVRVRARIINVENGKVFAVAKSEIIIDDNIKKLTENDGKFESRWSGESDKFKKTEYDKHLECAMQYIDKASSIAPTYTGEYNKREDLYKAALIELEIAISIFPNDTRAINMKRQIKSIINQ